eukprot:COSAG02_NODE_29247_length_573_cov_0.934599_2_plen_36_part_01
MHARAHAPAIMHGELDCVLDPGIRLRLTGRDDDSFS